MRIGTKKNWILILSVMNAPIWAVFALMNPDTLSILAAVLWSVNAGFAAAEYVGRAIE